MEQTTNEAVVQKNPGGARLKKGGKGPLVALGVIVGVLVLAYVGLCAYAGSLDTFYPNYHINGIAVGGLTVEQASQTLAAELPGQVMTLHCGDDPVKLGWPSDSLPSVTLGELGYTEERCGAIARRLFDQQKSCGFFSRGSRFLSAQFSSTGDTVSDEDLDVSVFQERVTQLALELALEPQDTTYSIGENSISITKAVNGRSVKEKALADALIHAICTYSSHGELVAYISFAHFNPWNLTAQAIYDEVAAEMKNAGYDAETDTITPEQLGAEFDVAAAQKALDAAAPGETVEIPAVIEYPKVTAEDLKTVLFRDVLGEAQTKVGGTAARKSNVKLSASSINGLVLNTGDVFSYNESVGQRTAANGYQPAPAYVKGETVDEIGGGICQTSSTLYLACLRGNLEITERYAHRYIPAYIAAGMDATVSWGGPDYKFTNDTDYPVKIVTEYKGDYLTVKLLGTNVTGITAKMTNEQLSTTPFEVVYEDDETLAPGTEQVKTTPYTGSKWKTYRHLYDANGKLISSSYEATSDYKARNKVILKGPAKAEVPAGGTAEIPVQPPVETPQEPVETPRETPEETPAEPETPQEPIIIIPDLPKEPEET
ncbi:VanW family protein [Oscillibacter sp.]|uniref:VanW family protein n=1 Tax=Oscillibacter sp. TaxID=1945593 RepID=UPI001B5EA9DC|nr:VanW family protein [Oscillibacter sp.]MBP3509372.1 VanW family protein [Oscillibacter sp.]